MDAVAQPRDHAPVRVLPQIKKLAECFGDFLVRVTCPCGASRHIEPEALARIAGRFAILAAPGTAHAVLAMRQESRRGRHCGETEAARRWATLTETPRRLRFRPILRLLLFAAQVHSQHFV